MKRWRRASKVPAMMKYLIYPLIYPPLVGTAPQILTTRAILNSHSVTEDPSEPNFVLVFFSVCREPLPPWCRNFRLARVRIAPDGHACVHSPDVLLRRRVCRHPLRTSGGVCRTNVVLVYMASRVSGHQLIKNKQTICSSLGRSAELE